MGKTTQIPQYLYEAGYSKAGKVYLDYFFHCNRAFGVVFVFNLYVFLLHRDITDWVYSA